MTNHKHTNALATESSPYLLQHQHNPVNWVPYSDEVFELAQKENKLVLISIGYSACHWCHVMEKESFENEDVAEVMNAHFICVKVDREERPDVDQVYMNAVQLMTQRGGWPLNCFTLPDGRPIYGGTYFPKDQWVHILKTLAETYKTDEAKFLEYAERLHEGMMVSELIDAKAEAVPFSQEKLDELIVVWKRSFDRSLGGNNRAPKFPMPNNYEFLLNYGVTAEDEEVKRHVLNTLNQMTWGGIYDQIGGGFSRYAVDIEWKVPHFEKMLYDNGQLMKLYAEAYQLTKDEEYKRVVYQTHDWLEREMRLKNGAYYAALDADSEGEEGKFYIWQKEELQELLTEEEFRFVEEVYNVNSKGYWEHDNYILLRKKSLANLAKERNISTEVFSHELSRIDKKLLVERNQRIAPGLDDKSLTSWNALLVSGYIQAYKAFQDNVFIDRATSCLNWILTEQIQSNGKLWHTYKNEVSKIDGFLEDYATVIDACFATYEVTMDERYLKRGVELLVKAIEEFYDVKSGMFWFTDNDSKLVVRKMEISDNVIPASNSIMARNLWHAYLLTDQSDFKLKAEQMLTNVYDGMHTYGSGYSNWASLLMQMIQPKREIVVIGPNAKQILSEINENYLPNILVVGSEEPRDFPLFKDRFKEGKTMIYYCENNACQLPVQTVEELRKLIRK